MDPARRRQVDPGGPEDEIATVIGIDPKALGMFPCRPRWLGQALCAVVTSCRARSSRSGPL